MGARVPSHRRVLSPAAESRRLVAVAVLLAALVLVAALLAGGWPSVLLNVSRP